MPAQSDTELVTLGSWTLRVRRSEGAPRHMLLLLHGWTGDENSMWVFARGLPNDFWIIAPRAPHQTRPSGYSWRIPPPDRTQPPDLEDLRSAAHDLVALVDEYCAVQKLEASEFDLMGFSQGAALACTLAVLFPERVGKVAVLAGFVPRGARSLMSGRPLDGKKFFVAHGTSDEMVSITYARDSVALLERAGAGVTFCEDDVGHKVSAGCLRGLQAFLLS